MSVKLRGFCFLPWWGGREQLLDVGCESVSAAARLGRRVRIHSAQGLVLCAPQTPRRQKRLFCRYHYGNRTPQLLIAPFKEEDEWDSPRIVRYYNVMSDEEIERIKEIAKPKVGASARPSGVTHPWYRDVVCGLPS